MKKKHTHGKGPELSRLGLIVYVSVVITDNPRGEESTGEVSIQVDLFTHPGTGEHKVTVKGKKSLRPIHIERKAEGESENFLL